MHDSAQLGTASALAWQGDTASQEVMGPVEEDAVVEGGLEVMGELGEDEDPGGVLEVSGGSSEDDGGWDSAEDDGSADEVGGGWDDEDDGSGWDEDVGSADVDVTGSLVGSGAAVAAQAQTERPALMAPRTSVGLHAARTQPRAVWEMAVEDAGVHRPGL
jgi:hypothetical protein